MRPSLLRLATGVLLITSCAPAHRGDVAFGAPSSPEAIALGAPANRTCEVLDSADDGSATSTTPSDRMAGVLRGEFRLPELLRDGPVDTLLLWIRYDSTGAFVSLSLSSRHDRRFDMVGSPSTGGPPAPPRAAGIDAEALYNELREQFVDSATPRLGATFLLVTGRGGGLSPADIQWACVPRLVNRSQTVRYLEDLYELRSNLITEPRSARLHIFVDQGGRPGAIRVHSGTGLAELDDALVRVGQQLEFEPALFGGFPVPVWVSQNLTIAPARER